jgi:hypothetical protein
MQKYNFFMKWQKLLQITAFGVGIEVTSAVAVGQCHPTSAEIHIHRLTAAVAIQHGVAINPNPILAGEVETAVVAMYFC